jgi:hypothetical protein
MGRSREKGIKTKMLVKLSAKLLVIAWTLMKNKTSFDPCFLKQGNASSHCQEIKPKSGRFSRASEASPVRDRQTLEKRPDEG